MTSPSVALPPIAGREAQIAQWVKESSVLYRNRPPFTLDALQSACACALHMHQPTIPAGENGALISHLQYMYEHLGEGDNHNADPFAQCYRRMGDIIPRWVDSGAQPRIMLDYSGNLLWGFEQMGRGDILDNLKRITLDGRYQGTVEWLGTFWSHSVVPSTPIPDLKLQMVAWQHHFAAIFGQEALQRVKGFSPPEMHLPNHPDTLYEYVKALKECGYRWLMVQEHSVETLTGEGLPTDQKYIPNRLVARNSQGEGVSITALIKTQGSDTKLVGQMQPYYEALSRSPLTLGGRSIPPCVTQIADGENGGVMMNEFPSAYDQAMEKMTPGSGTVMLNGTEYLELLAEAGLTEADFPPIQAVHQHKIWQRVNPDRPSMEAVETAIAQLKAEDSQFSMEGASWTNNLSWVRGYENVLGPMNRLSARFHEIFDARVAADPSVTQTPEYQTALLYLLLVETSCFRYWGQGVWTDYAQILYQRGEAALDGVSR